MGPVWMRAVSEMRARKRALISAAILCGLFGAAALAILAGARRTESAYPRFLERNRGYDVLASDSSVFSDVFWKVDFDRLARLPYVDTAVPMVYGGWSDDLAIDVPTTFIASRDPRFLRDIHRPIVVEGRLPDPKAPEEIAVPYFADKVLGRLRVGDVLTVTIGGERVRLRVVGREVVPGEIPPQPQFGWTILATSAFLDKYEKRVDYILPSMMLRFDRHSDVVKLEQAAQTFAGGKVFAPQEAESHTRAVQGSTTLQSSALRILAAFIALTGALILAQVLARETTIGAEESATLRALGFDRWQLFRLGILRVVPIAIAGALIAMIVAWGASPLFPRGSVRILERTDVPVFDAYVLGVGAAVIAAAVFLLVIAPAWRSAVAAGRVESAPIRPSPVATAVSAAGLSVPAVAGARLALERGRGRSAVPVFSSMLIVSLGIASFIAATTFGRSLDRMTNDRELQGKTWDGVINTLVNEEQFPPPEAERLARERATALAGDPNIEALAFADSGAPLRLFSDAGPPRGVSILGLTIINIKGSMYCPIVEGHAPRNPGEVVLGARMIKALGVHLDPARPPTIQVSLQGGVKKAPLRVVGRAVIPPLGNFGELGYGMMLGDFSGIVSLVDDPASAPPTTDLIVRWRKGAKPKDVIARYTKRFPDVRLGDDVAGGRFADVVSFGGVEGAPLAVGGVLAALGAAALGHVLITAIRRRRRDVAILKTIGFVRGQARRVVAWQATIMVVIATAIGVPLGIATGRWLWSIVANGIGVLPESRLDTLVLVALAPVVLLLANVIAAPPARSAARTQPALVLRSE